MEAQQPAFRDSFQLGGDSQSPEATPNSRQDEVINYIRSLLQSEEWLPIERALAHAGHIKLVPANHAFFRHFNDPRYETLGFVGCPSAVTKTALEHFPAAIPNFWFSEFTSLCGKVNFSFLRSGTLTRYGEKDVASRTAATDVAAESLINALAALCAFKSDQVGDKVKLVTIDLQSPSRDEASEWTESITVREQRHALERRAESPVVVAGEARKLEFTHLVIPTHENTFEYKTEWPLTTEMLEGIMRFRESISSEVSAESATIFDRLNGDLNALLMTELEGTSTPITRYAIAARLVIMGHLSGNVMHFNCRSGKDRTGFLDVEVKFLGYQIARELQGLPVSKVGQPLLEDEKYAWKELLLESGNLEIQKLNSGHKGSLLRHALLDSRVGHDNLKEFIGEAYEAVKKLEF